MRLTWIFDYNRFAAALWSCVAENLQVAGRSVNNRHSISSPWPVLILQPKYLSHYVSEHARAVLSNIINSAQSSAVKQHLAAIFKRGGLIVEWLHFKYCTPTSQIFRLALQQKANLDANFINDQWSLVIKPAFIEETTQFELRPFRLLIEFTSKSWNNYV